MNSAEDMLNDLIPAEERQYVTVARLGSRGWFLIGEGRFFGDSGEDYLGKNAVEAKRMLEFIYRQPQQK